MAHTHTGPYILNLPLKRDFVFFTFPEQQGMHTLTVLHVLFIQAVQECAFIFLPFSGQVACEERVKEMRSPQRLSKQQGTHSEARIADVGRGGTGMLSQSQWTKKAANTESCPRVSLKWLSSTAQSRTEVLGATSISH